MLKRVILIGGVTLLFVYGLVHLFLLRFEVGDVYPEYSSLRTDPLGAKAFYDAIVQVPDLAVGRNYRAIEKLRPEAPTTLIYAGTPHRAFWGEDELRAVEALVANGARVVITFLPVTREEASRTISLATKKAREQKEQKAKEGRATGSSKEPKKAGEKPESKRERAAPKEEDEDEENEGLISFDEVALRWGFKFEHWGSGSKLPVQALRGDAGVSLEEEISWHSALGFSLMDSQWQSIYSSGSGPVVIERAYGKGSIVLAADSYFLSNEALRKERTPKLLSWLVGGSTLVVFDEESHGVRDSPGLASLIAKYGLRGAFAGLLLLAVLFIWKNAAPFIPPFEEADATLVLGKQANEGFVNLLRRSISPQAILGVCAEEWKKSFDHDGSNLKSAHLERVIASEKAKALRQRDTVAAFQTICAEFAPQSSKPKRR